MRTRHAALYNLDTGHHSQERALHQPRFRVDGTLYDVVTVPCQDATSEERRTAQLSERGWLRWRNYLGSVNVRAGRDRRGGLPRAYRGSRSVVSSRRRSSGRRRRAASTGSSRSSTDPPSSGPDDLAVAPLAAGGTT